MKILYINGMGPVKKASLSGIFVSQRILALKKLGVQIVPVNARLVYSYVLQLLRRLKRISDNGKLLSQQLNIDYYVITVKVNLYDILKARISPTAYKKVLKRDLYSRLKMVDADVIHLHWCWPVGLILPELAAKQGIPYVLTFHGSDINIQLQNPTVKPVMLDIMENAASVEFVSQALLDRAIVSGYSGENAIVIYNGIDTDTFYRKPDQDRDKDRHKCVGFVGNLLPVKGADRLPEIFSRIMVSYKDELDFIVVGQGDLAEKLKEQMESLPVTFTGQLSPKQLSDIYNRMDVLVVPSRNEGYSCVIKEAQACGVIPGGCDVGGIGEAVGLYGSVVPVVQEDELCGQLAGRVVDYLEGKFTINLEEMAFEAEKCSWTARQKESLRNYEQILLNSLSKN